MSRPPVEVDNECPELKEDREGIIDSSLESPVSHLALLTSYIVKCYSPLNVAENSYHHFIEISRQKDGKSQVALFLFTRNYIFFYFIIYHGHINSAPSSFPPPCL